MLSERASYRIVYLAEFEIFKITLLTPEIEHAQQEAEKEFLYVTKLQKADACQLHVEIIIAPYLEIPQAGTISPLSFCTGNES